jgi:type III secretion YscU/HrpY family protein
MAQKNDGGDKTEKPTSKKLKDARKKGDVPKSTELTNTAELILWLALFGLGLAYAGERISTLMDATFANLSGSFTNTAPALGWMALETVLVITALFLIPIILFGLLVEFLQAGPVLSFEKIKPKMDSINPAEGLKRMFSLDSLVEGIKALVKTVLLFFIGWLVLKALLPELVLLPRTNPNSILAAMWEIALKLLGWTIGLFALLSILDAAYQRHSFTKKMRMSMRDIKQEVKENEGDPYIKAQRRQMHQEWAQQGAAQATRDATTIIVNPTHVAIALDYDRDNCPVPTIAAKGEDHVARAMREAAEEAGVPIVRNVDLARDLLARSEVGDIIPRDLFDIIAEVILWAKDVREDIERSKQGHMGNIPDTDTPRRTAPGEDLTCYPDHRLRDNTL